MRITLTRLLIAVLLLIIIILTWTIAKDYNNKNEYTVEVCQQSEDFMTNLHDLAFRVHSVLTKLDLTHFLCYDSLWGQIRMSKALPWAISAQICILNEEILPIEEAKFIRTFTKSELNIKYFSSEGIYEITDSNFMGGKVELIVFEQDKMMQMYRRIGWKRRVLPPDCKSMKSLECFPPRLIAPPLAKKEFGTYVFPVPREGIELQKYHYENNWWKDMKPKNC